MTSEKINLAPIAFFVYNRPVHAQLTIESIKKNKLSVESDLFVFSDGSKVDGDENVKKVREYIKTIDGFKSVAIIEREKNLGLANSIIEGVTEIVNRHGKIIVVEDDLLVSPYILEYLNKALSIYEKDERVVHVDGFCEGNLKNLPETFFLKTSGNLGWATWKRAWDIFEEDADKLLTHIESNNLTKEFDKCGNYKENRSFSQLLRDQIEGKVDSWAVRWAASVFINDCYGLFPGKSMVFHIGFHGTHFNDSFLLDIQKLKPPLVKIVPVKIKVVENIRIKNRYFIPVKKNRFDGIQYFFEKVYRKMVKVPALKTFKTFHKIFINCVYSSKLFHIFTHLTNDEKLELNTLARSFKRNVIAVEIGSYLGSSSCFIASGLSKKSVLYCIDTWGNHAMRYNENDTDPEERDTYEEFLQNTKDYSDKIKMIRKWSYDAIDDLRKEIDTVDFLFIDGDHSYEGVKKDWDLYSPLLKEGSLVVFHDTGWAEGVKKVVEEDVCMVGVKIKELPNMEVFRII